MHMLLSSDTTVLISSFGIYKIRMDCNVTRTTSTSSFSSKEKNSGDKTELLSRGHLQIHVVIGKVGVEELGHRCSDYFDIDSVHSTT